MECGLPGWGLFYTRFSNGPTDHGFAQGICSILMEKYVKDFELDVRILISFDSSSAKTNY